MKWSSLLSDAKPGVRYAFQSLYRVHFLNSVSLSLLALLNACALWEFLFFWPFANNQLSESRFTIDERIDQSNQFLDQTRQTFMFGEFDYQGTPQPSIGPTRSNIRVERVL